VHLAHAARLLADAASDAGLAALARAAGVSAPPVALPRATRDRLAPGGAVAGARVCAGPGPLHALLATVEGPPLRDTAAHLATHLAARAPDPRWLLVLRHASDGSAALVTWEATARGPRVAALRFEPGAALPSDAETLRTLAARAAAATDPLLVHRAWLDALTRDALNARFYRTLDATVRALADSLPPSVRPPADRADLALLATTRLLFLAFLEAKGWLDGDRAFLARHYDAAVASGGRVHARLLRPLFFGTLNTPRRDRAPAARAFGRVPFLNGGLFAPAALERRHRAAALGDAPLGTLVHGLLAGHRFTPREDAAAWSEAAVDPEMLGRAFECLMSARDRHTTGAFYTPRPLVEHATAAALRQALAGAGVDESDVEHALAGRAPPPAAAARLRARVAALRLADPACGSGAFLVHALERLADLLAACGDPRPLADRRQAVLTRSIFGVDVNPTAVWLCELRLWLSVVVERDAPDPHAVPPLPNLDHNVRVGDALAVPPALAPLARAGWGGAPWAAGAPAPGGPAGLPAGRTDVAALRARYAALAGPRKRAAARRLDAAERAHALAALDTTLAGLRHARREALAAARAPDLFGGRARPSAATRRRLADLRDAVRAATARRRAAAQGGALPFGFAWHFADAAAAAGFDLLLGNPPWVRPHALDAAARSALRTVYASARPLPAHDTQDVTPADGLLPAAALVRAPAFGAQVDLAALFTERALALTRPGGTVAFLVPAKLWRTLAGGALRDLLARHAHVRAIEDWSDAPATFDAAVYPSLLVARRRLAAATSPAARAAADHAPTVRVHRGRAVAEAHRTPSLALDPHTPGSPWLLVPPDVRAAFDALRGAGPALRDTALPRPTLGTKCGCNDAFLVHVEASDGVIARVRRGDRTGTVERALLRPVLRGEHLAAPPDAPPANEYLLWTHAPDGGPLDTLPPHAAAWLAPWRERLAGRSDARGAARWWAVFRTEGAAATHTRVVWPDLARAPHPRILAPGDPTVPLNSCYVARFDDLTDAHTFAALLAAPPVAAWLATLAEPARGGYRRFLAWTVALLPTPPDWARARNTLADLGPSAPPDELTRAVLSLYDIRPTTVAALIDWSGYLRPADPLPSRAPGPPASTHPPAPGLASFPPVHRVRESAWATHQRPAGHAT
jgi:hypothetical protein